MAAERRLTSSVVVDRPIEQVWELVSDTRRYAEYVDATLEVTRSDGQARVGATYDERNKFIGPFKVSSKWRVTEYDPPRSQVHVTDRWPLVKGLRIAWECEPAGEGTRLLHWVEYVPGLGPLGSLLDLVMRGQVQKDMDGTTANFKALAERELGRSAGERLVSSG